MELKEEFEKAMQDSRSLTRRPDDASLLQLYALYKQATEGDVSGDRPGGFDFKAIAKYNAWEEKKSMSKDEAMRQYVALVNQLRTQFG